MTIVELKKPMRSDYDFEKKTKNPVAQVLGYIRAVRDKKAKDRDGQIIELHPHAPIYAYIVCTIRAKLERILEDRGFVKTPDGLGYYWYNNPYRAHIEVVPHTKLLADANKRNAVFFEKIGLPDSIVEKKRTGEAKSTTTDKSRAESVSAEVLRASAPPV